MIELEIGSVTIGDQTKNLKKCECISLTGGCLSLLFLGFYLVTRMPYNVPYVLCDVEVKDVETMTMILIFWRIENATKLSTLIALAPFLTNHTKEHMVPTEKLDLFLAITR